MWAGYSKSILLNSPMDKINRIFISGTVVLYIAAISSPHQQGASAHWTAPTLQHRGQRYRRKNLKAFRVSAVLDSMFTTFYAIRREIFRDVLHREAQKQPLPTKHPDPT